VSDYRASSISLVEYVHSVALRGDHQAMEKLKAVFGEEKIKALQEQYWELYGRKRVEAEARRFGD